MRKDVKRSLLLWPAAASVTITAVSWLPTQLERELGARPQLVTAPPLRSHIKLLVTESDAVSEPVEVVARQEHGNRGLRMPDRVATAFGIPTPVLKAPVRDEDQELAGLALRSASILRADRWERTQGRSQDDITVQQSLARMRSRREDELRRTYATELRSAAFANEVRTAEKFAAAPPEHLSSDPSLETTETQSAATKHPSILPPSNRLMARRELNSEHTEAEQLSGTEVELGAAFSEPTSNTPSFNGSAAAFGSVGDLSPVDPSELRGLRDRSYDPSARDAQLDASREHQLPANLSNPAGWPVTTKLDQQLEQLSAMAVNARPQRRDRLASHAISESSVTKWTAQVSNCLESLRSLPRLGDDRAGELIGNLEALAIDGNRQAEQVEDRAQQVHWLCTAYAVQRRVAIWKLVWEVSRGESDWMVGDLAKLNLASVEEALQDVRNDLDETGDVAGWNRYLLLDEIRDNRGDLDREQSKVLAQRFLSRLQWHRLSEEQKRWLQRPSVSGLAAAVRPWAQDAIDYAQMMQEIEVQETDAIDLVSLNLASAVQTLRYAENPTANRIAEAIDTHYRNANVRIALSDDLLDRMIPRIEPHNIPVRSHVLGSQVRGQSRVESDLGIQLIPSSDRWNLLLRAQGNVATRSTGSRSIVAVHTSGHSEFDAGKAIEITKRGIELEDTTVKVSGRTRLRNIETDFDGWPLLGTLARSLAEDRYESMAPKANRIANRTLQQRIQSEIDETVQTRADRATEQLSDLVLGPLSSLKLDPKVTDLETTDERLLARFRLAGDWQMAAFTPRPRAPKSSLMSVQIHQSALNNTIEQLLPRGQATSIETMLANIATTFGQEAWTMPEDIPSDVTIQFSSTRPVTVEIEDDRLWITLRIIRLRRPGSVDLTNFIVRAAYKPQMDGIHASLVRDGHLRISGPRMSMRERLPARTIFNKVLSSNREIPVVVPRLQQHPAMEGMAVSQLELRHGWMAVAISEEDAPRIAAAP